jgi:hypothetical protein
MAHLLGDPHCQNYLFVRGGYLIMTPIHRPSENVCKAKFAEHPTGELQALWSCTLRSPPSVSNARKRRLGDWGFPYSPVLLHRAGPPRHYLENICHSSYTCKPGKVPIHPSA